MEVITQMTSLLESVEDVFTGVITWMGSMVTFITGQPLLLLGVGLMLAGAAIGFLSRLIRTV